MQAKTDPRRTTREQVKRLHAAGITNGAEIARMLRVSRAAVSHHIKALRKAGEL